MLADRRFRILSVIAFGCVVGAAITNPAQSQSSAHAPSSAADLQAQAALSNVLAGIFSDTSSHMRMGPSRRATTADSARAAAIVVAARAALGQYVDVKAAERDGYYRNMPWLDDQPIYHYNSRLNFQAAAHVFDPAKPVSLLYKKNAAGELRLIGAMYATGASAASEELDALLPISMAHWHEHVNLCYPRRVSAREGPPKADAGTVFLVKLYFSITSANECDAAGGQFVPIDFGWMAHVYMFAGSDDPEVIWGTDDVGNMDMRMQHPSSNARR